MRDVLIGGIGCRSPAYTPLPYVRRAEDSLAGGYRAIGFMQKDQPAVVHGVVTSPRLLTHHRGFAVGCVSLLGNANTIGEAIASLRTRC